MNNIIENIVKNTVVALTVSFVALSLGAAFGILSGRENGVFIGILSAGIIAIITSILGGTKVQCSGPTAPMTAVITPIILATNIGIISTWATGEIEIKNANHFINTVILLSGIITIFCGILKLGKYISFIPSPVISGFMNGIAILIIISQIGKLFGINNFSRIEGDMFVNLSIVILTLAIIFLTPKLISITKNKFLRIIPGSLLAILVISISINIFDVNVEMLIKDKIDINKDFIMNIVSGQFSTNYDFIFILAALPFAFQLALLCYLDTLITTLVIERMTRSKSNYNKELVSQGIANSLITTFGGIPGAQATIRSVLMVKEGASSRLAGILVGIFVIIQLFLFFGLVSFIPQAIFVGILIKVAYDIFDWQPIISWTKDKINRKEVKNDFTDSYITYVILTTFITVVFNLNLAVIGVTLLYYLIKKLL